MGDAEVSEIVANSKWEKMQKLSEEYEQVLRMYREAASRAEKRTLFELLTTLEIRMNKVNAA